MLHTYQSIELQPAYVCVLSKLLSAIRAFAEPKLGEASGLIKVVAMPSKIVENPINTPISYTLAEGPVRVLYAVGCLSLGTVHIIPLPFQFSGYLRLSIA